MHDSNKPIHTIGILGGGQLGRMMALAGAHLGYRFHIYTPEADAPASAVAAQTTLAAWDDEAALLRFARSVDVVTLEFENIPVSTIQFLKQHVRVAPDDTVLATTQDRVLEKQSCASLGIRTAPFAAINNITDLENAIASIGAPGILKTNRFGYDGKGQAKIHSAADASAAWQAIGQQPAIYEGFVDFTAEASIIIARNQAGDTALYPLVENTHKNHILHQTIVPAAFSAPIMQTAETYAMQLANHVQLVGLLAVELFITRDGSVLVNEMAPRPHNSGHWTMDACQTSQFEQIIRAVCNLPLGGTAITHPAVMTNLIGHDIVQAATLLQDPKNKLHIYGKSEIRAGRKMGHVTRVG